MNENITINENLILAHMNAEDNKQVLCELSKKMYEQGFVKDTFCEAILNREQKFPTGIKCGNYNFAIPHTESVYVNKTCIGVATLQQGVDFLRIDEPTEYVKVSLVVLLASTGGHDHIEMLASVIRMLQNETIVKNLVNAENSYDIAQILKQFLVGGSGL